MTLVHNLSAGSSNPKFMVMGRMSTSFNHCVIVITRFLLYTGNLHLAAPPAVTTVQLICQRPRHPGFSIVFPHAIRLY